MGRVKVESFRGITKLEKDLMFRAASGVFQVLAEGPSFVSYSRGGGPVVGHLNGRRR